MLRHISERLVPHTRGQLTIPGGHAPGGPVLRSSIQDMKKFVTDPDPNKNDAAPEKSKKCVLKMLIYHALCVDIFKLFLMDPDPAQL